jgi:hypothetical protein
MTKPEDPFSHRTTIPTMLFRWAVIVFSAGSLALSSLFFYKSDEHNDTRYVRLNNYNNDRERDKEVRDLVKAQFDGQMAELNKKTGEISADVKTLLWRDRPPKQ